MVEFRLNGSIGGPNVFTNFNPFWGAIRGTLSALPGPFYKPRIRIGDYSVLKGALGSSIFESGVFDRTGPSVDPVVNGEISRRGQPIPDVIVRGIFRAPSPAPPKVSQESDVAIDWGGIFTTAAGTAISGLGARYGVPMGIGPGAVTPAVFPTIPPGADILPEYMGGAPCPPVGTCGAPRYLTYDCKTGSWSPRRRRRRRRLLTNQDVADLSALQSIAGKGAALQMAIATAVRR